MKNNVVSIASRGRHKKQATKLESGFSFTDEVEKDLGRLMDKLSCDRDEAMKVATNFYRSYPMLMELVRTPNHLLGGK